MIADSPVRLVKGAYWTARSSAAQERGLADYPVFTRKAMTDANYLACARLMLASERLYPQFATHNALTVRGCYHEAGARENFEFQRLHGMGERLPQRRLNGRAFPGASMRRWGRTGTSSPISCAALSRTAPILLSSRARPIP